MKTVWDNEDKNIFQLLQYHNANFTFKINEHKQLDYI